MAPRGMGTMVAMMIVGKLTHRIDPRILILSGLALTAVSLFQMSLFTTYVPPFMLIWTGAMQGFGLGFIFVPLSTVAYATLAPQYRAEAASVFSLTRNMGSSIGISMVMAVLGRNMQINHAYLSEYITPFSAGMSINQLPGSLASQAGAALALLDAEVSRQAATIAYLNDFRLMMWIVIAAAPLVLLLRRPAPVVA
jgi:DHA2 family multidrug resistance protein